MSEKLVERISLSVGTWVSLTGMIATAIAANLALIYSMSGNLQARMDALDVRWQDRTSNMQQNLVSEIKAVEAKIPPDWFRQMVDRNATAIDKLKDEFDRLENEFTRDVVRKSER